MRPRQLSGTPRTLKADHRLCPQCRTTHSTVASALEPRDRADRHPRNWPNAPSASRHLDGSIRNQKSVTSQTLPAGFGVEFLADVALGLAQRRELLAEGQVVGALGLQARR